MDLIGRRQDDTLRNVVRVEKGPPELNAIEGMYGWGRDVHDTRYSWPKVSHGMHVLDRDCSPSPRSSLSSRIKSYYICTIHHVGTYLYSRYNREALLYRRVRV